MIDRTVMVARAKVTIHMPLAMPATRGATPPASATGIIVVASAKATSSSPRAVFSRRLKMSGIRRTPKVTGTRAPTRATGAAIANPTAPAGRARAASNAPRRRAREASSRRAAPTRAVSQFTPRPASAATDQHQQRLVEQEGADDGGQHEKRCRPEISQRERREQGEGELRISSVLAGEEGWAAPRAGLAHSVSPRFSK